MGRQDRVQPPQGQGDSWRHPETQKTFAPGKSGVTGYRGIRLSEDFGQRMREAETNDKGNGWTSWSK